MTIELQSWEFQTLEIDIDECEVGCARCPEDMKCKNQRGLYRCECENGIKIGSQGYQDICISVFILVIGASIIIIFIGMRWKDPFENFSIYFCYFYGPHWEIYQKLK